MYSFPDLEPVYCSMSSSNCCFLTCIQVSQEADQVVCSFPSLEEFSTVCYDSHKGLIVNEAEAGIKIARRNSNNLRYADDTTLMAESEEELKNPLDESERGE